METIITPYLQKLEFIKQELTNVAKLVVIENKENIMNIVKFSQLELGIKSDGTSAGVYKGITEQYANFQDTVKPKGAGDPFNFQWSGATFAFMDIKADAVGEFDIFSTSGKQELLDDIYGKLFDLTDEHNEFVNLEIILPELQKYILDNLVLI
jgi:hypothetical protein